MARRKNPLTGLVIIGAAALLVTSMAYASQDPIVFPAGGQSEDQIESDKLACYSWAKKQTGFDPMRQQAAASPQAEPQGGAVKGAARGALLGVTVGAITGDAGKGAAIGAASGGLIGGAKRQDRKQQQQQQAQQQAARQDQHRQEYQRAWTACMEGKNYTVR